MTVCHHNGVSLSSGRASTGRLALHRYSWPRLVFTLPPGDLQMAAQDGGVIPARGASFLAASYVCFTHPLLLRCLICGQMAHQREERFWEALSQDLGTISSNVLGISHAGGNSIWASLTGMSLGLSRCRNIEGAYMQYLQYLHFQKKKKKKRGLVRTEHIKMALFCKRGEGSQDIQE